MSDKRYPPLSAEQHAANARGASDYWGTPDSLMEGGRTEAHLSALTEATLAVYTQLATLTEVLAHPPYPVPMTNDDVARVLSLSAQPREEPQEDAVAESRLNALREIRERLAVLPVRQVWTGGRMVNMVEIDEVDAAAQPVLSRYLGRNVLAETDPVCDCTHVRSSHLGGDGTCSRPNCDCKHFWAVTHG